MKLSLLSIMAMLAASVSVARAITPEGSADDHHLCYKAKAGDPKFVAIDSVTLLDAFESAPAKVLKAALICNPADAGAGLIDNATHLEAYKIKSSIKHVPHLNVAVVDTLGSLSVDTKKAEFLLVPGATQTGTPPAAPLFGSHNVDHYKCYKVKVSSNSVFNQQQVSLTDQYSGTPKLFDIRKPKHLCLPVNLNNTGVKNPLGHLMCYQAKPASGQPTHVPVLGLRVGNEFGQPESLNTKKEDEICFPAVTDPSCGDNRVNQASEECDGTSDAACPGQCSSNCGCWRAHAFNLNPVQSRVEIRGINTGGAGLNNSFTFTGLAGTISINTGNQIRPGQYEVAVPVTSLPPLDVNIPGYGSVGTACVFLQEDPDLPGSGLAGKGVVDCNGGGLVDDLPSPHLFSHQDHCTNGTSCDSGTTFASPCTPPWRFDEPLLGPGKLHPGTGACVPAGPTDNACTASDALTGTTANLEEALDPHPATCNSPVYGKLGAASYSSGDAVIILNVAVEVRGAGDPCTTPPTSSPIRGPLTTGTATSTIMDAFPSLPGTGKVQALELFGVPFSCVASLPQHGDPLTGTSGVTFVTAISALDLVLPAGPPFNGASADLNTGLVLKAQ